MSGATGASEALTPQEEAFFATGGQDTSAFDAPAPEPGPPAADPAPAPVPATPATPAAPAAAAAAPAADPSDDELIDQAERDAIGEDGKPTSGGQFIRLKNFRAVSGKMKTFRTERDDARKERDTANAELQKLREDRARLDERLNIALSIPPQAQQPAAPAAPAAPQPPAAPPDVNVDPLGALAYAMEQITALRGDLTKTQDQTTQVNTTIQVSQEDQQIATAFNNDAQRFAGANPDFGAAYTHLLNVRNQSLILSGVADLKERNRIWHAEEKNIILTAFRAGKSPAEAFYELAKTVGYTKPAAPTTEPAAAPQPATPAAPAPAAPTAVEEVTRLANAQNAAKSLSGAGGGAPVLQMTIEKLLAMTDSEFAAYDRANPGVVARLMGKD